jgi:hypothetical protein
MVTRGKVGGARQLHRIGNRTLRQHACEDWRSRLAIHGVSWDMQATPRRQVAAAARCQH